MVDLKPYIGPMWYISEWWIAENQVPDMTWAFDMAKELYVKPVFMAAFPDNGVYYTPEENFVCYPGVNDTPMSRTLIKDTIELVHNYGMRTVAYMAQHCRRDIAESQYPECIFKVNDVPVRTAENYYVMDIDPNKSFGQALLQQLIGILDDWGHDGIEMDMLYYDSSINDGVTGETLYPDNYMCTATTPLSKSISDWLREARQICNSRNKVLMGNAPRTQRVSQHLDLVIYHSTRLKSEGVCQIDLRWYEFLRQVAMVKPSTPIWIRYAPTGEHFDGNRATLESYLAYCLDGTVLPWVDWNHQIVFAHDNKDLYDIYVPPIIRKLTPTPPILATFSGAGIGVAIGYAINPQEPFVPMLIGAVSGGAIGYLVGTVTS